MGVTYFKQLAGFVGGANAIAYSKYVNKKVIHAYPPLCTLLTLSQVMAQVVHHVPCVTHQVPCAPLSVHTV